MKIVVDTKENIAGLVAGDIFQCVRENSRANLAFSAGRSTAVLETALSGNKELFENVNVFNVCDYIELAPDDIRGCSESLRQTLYQAMGINEENIHTPNGESDESAAAYDNEIAEKGGIDLAVLGMGLNGHIGFNEPATLYDSYTHIAQLTDSTKRMKAELFSGEENVPDHAVTMGLKTLCGAKKVILMAFGEEKADIVHKLVYGKTSTYVPAAMLQMHMDMILYLDKDAASKI